ncbi:seminal metalloprotease 1 isoform X3 [Spodoptera frugiperda]|uniref:Metalloendopeptidase n=1 Tax=Spodoptera frugiperda TaxID=7108 RepID=A0A9R0EXV8_SPOFR|nr:seminal metalloprotease 1 isoform X3 [Spodoptera frugiperda]
MQQFHVRLVVLSIIIVTSISAGSPIYDNVDFETDDAPIYDYVDFETDGEYGDYFEGDTAMPDSQPQAIDGSFARNGLIDETRRWPNHTVVYHINEEDFDEEQLSKINAAMADIANHSCVIFRPRETDDEHAVIIKGSDICSAKVGYAPYHADLQVIELADTCFKHGTIIHELLHTLGFRHMHSTYDRDDYIDVLWDNVQPGYEENFIKDDSDYVTNFGVPYDYNSVLHYTESAFTANGNNTIIPLKENVTNIGQRDGLSHGDILKVNRMYCVNNGTGDEDDPFAEYDEEVSIDK